MLIDYSKQKGKKIATKGDKKKFINIEDIMYIKSEDYLSTLFLKNGKKIHDIKPLREFEERLFDLGFFRIRSNTIINGDYITEMDTRMNKRIIKLEEIDFIVARSRLKSFRDWIS